MTGRMQCELMKQAIAKLHGSGVIVVSVTSDATAYNIQMASLLGTEVDGVDKASFTAYVIIIFQLNYHKRCCGRQSRTVLSYNG